MPVSTWIDKREGSLVVNFIIAYRGGKKPESPEAGAEQRERWKAWVGGLGDAVVNPGTPLRNARTVSAGGVAAGPDTLTGFTVVKADSIDVALEMAKACPYLEVGTIEVAEMVEM
jgi:hypothetical protein